MYLTDKNPARISSELFKPCCFLWTLPATAAGNEEAGTINKSPKLHLLFFHFRLPWAIQSSAGPQQRMGAESLKQIFFILEYMLRKNAHCASVNKPVTMEFVNIFIKL